MVYLITSQKCWMLNPIFFGISKSWLLLWYCDRSTITALWRLECFFSAQFVTLKCKKLICLPGSYHRKSHATFSFKSCIFEHALTRCKTWLGFILILFRNKTSLTQEKRINRLFNQCWIIHLNLLRPFCQTKHSISIIGYIATMLHTKKLLNQQALQYFGKCSSMKYWSWET